MRWARAEAEIERRLTDLHAQAVLPPPRLEGGPDESESARRLAQSVRLLDKWLFEHARGLVTAGAPWSWRPDERHRLAIALAPAEPFFRQVDALLSGADAGSLRERGEGLGRALESPAHRRTWVRLLCARAVLEASSEGGSAGAARALGQALDLVHLLDQPTSWGLLSRQSLEALALGALQQILREGQVDAISLRAALEPRLRTAADVARIDDALAGDLRAWTEQRRPAQAGASWSALLVHPGALERQVATLRSFERARALALLPREERELWPRVRNRASDGHDASWSAVVEAWRAHQSALALARVALALAEWRQRHGSWPESLEHLRGAFEGGLPLDPCSARPFPWSPAHARLGPTAFSARSAGSQAREERQLHLWRLQVDVR